MKYLPIGHISEKACFIIKALGMMIRFRYYDNYIVFGILNQEP